MDRSNGSLGTTAWWRSPTADPLIGVASFNRQTIVNDVVGLAKAAGRVDVAVVLSAVDGTGFSGPTFPLLAAPGNPEPIDSYLAKGGRHDTSAT